MKRESRSEAYLNRVPFFCRHPYGILLLIDFWYFVLIALARDLNFRN